MMRRILILAISILLCCAGCNGTPTPVHPTAITETPTPDVCQEIVNMWTIVNHQQQVYIAAMPTLIAVETRLAELQATTCATPVSTLTPTSVHTATPTSTPGYTPTAPPQGTPTPAIDPLCTRCAKGCTSGAEGCCPIGYTCANCYSAGFRCVRVASPNADSLTCRGMSVLPANAKSWQGIATWTGAEYEGKTMRNGQPYLGTDHTAAVVATQWYDLQDDVLRVCFQNRCVDVTVCDSFYASDWRLDLSAAAFKELAPHERGVITVDVYLLFEP